jgi:hypothetical protein
VLSSGFLRHVVWYKFTDVSEVLAATIRVMAMMMESASTFQTSVDFYQTTWRNKPEDSHFHARRRENLKSQLNFFTYRITFINYSRYA